MFALILLSALFLTSFAPSADPTSALALKLGDRDETRVHHDRSASEVFLRVT